MHLEVLIAFFLASVPKGLALVMRDTYTPQGQITQYLVAHNSVRVQHGAQALVYSQELAMKAQQWADQCVFEHSGGSLGPFGENLAAGAGTGSNYQFTIAAAVKGWTDEVKDYNATNPKPSHFTQVVWKGTKEVGCAFQTGCNGIFDPKFGKATYYVCEYFPQGNIIGQFFTNVQIAPTGNSQAPNAPQATVPSNPAASKETNSAGRIQGYHRLNFAVLVTFFTMYFVENVLS